MDWPESSLGFFFHSILLKTQMNFLANPIQSKTKFSSVQSLSHVLLFVTPWTTTRQASLSITNSRSLPKFMSTESVMPYNHLILCHWLLLLPLIFPNIRVFSSESALHIRWPKYCSFSFNISPSNERNLTKKRKNNSWVRESALSPASPVLEVLGPSVALLGYHSFDRLSLFCPRSLGSVPWIHPGYPSSTILGTRSQDPAEEPLFIYLIVSMSKSGIPGKIRG